MGVKTIRRALLVAAAIAALQPVPGHAEEKMKEKQQQFFDPKNEVLHFENHLKLTDKQKPEVLKILEDKLAMYKREAARRDRISKETRELSEKIQANNRELESVQRDQQEAERTLANKMRSILTDEQRKKFDALEAERLRQQREFQAAHQGRRSGDGQPGSGAMGDQPGAEGAVGPGGPPPDR